MMANELQALNFPGSDAGETPEDSGLRFKAQAPTRRGTRTRGSRYTAEPFAGNNERRCTKAWISRSEINEEKTE